MFTMGSPYQLYLNPKESSSLTCVEPKIVINPKKDIINNQNIQATFNPNLVFTRPLHPSIQKIMKHIPTLMVQGGFYQ